MGYAKKVAAPLFFLLALLLFFYPIIGSDRVYFARDFQLLFYPMKFHLAQSYASGEFPFWFGASYGGAPFLADMQSGVFYPPSVIFWLFPFPLSLNLFIVFHFLCGGCFLYLLARVRGASFFPAIIGGAAFIFSGYLLSTVNVLNNLQAAVWAPAVLWAASKFFQTRSAGYWTLTVLALAMVTLGGEPQVLFITVAILFLYSAVCLNAFSLKNFLLLAGALALSQLVCAVQWLPTLEAFHHSVRSGGVSLEMAARHSLNVSDLSGIVSPRRFSNPNDIDTLKIFHNGEIPYLMSIFSGKVLVTLSLLALLAPKRETLFWALALALSLLLALGETTPLFGISHSLLPWFRFPEKYFFIAALAIPMLAIMGAGNMEKFLDRKGFTNIAPPVMMALLLFVLVELFGGNLRVNPTVPSNFYLAPANSVSAGIKTASHPIESLSPSILDKQKKWRIMHLPLIGAPNGEIHALGQGGLELETQSVATELANKLAPIDLIKFYRLIGVEIIYTDDPRLTDNVDFLSATSKIGENRYRLKNSSARFRFAWRLLATEKEKAIEGISQKNFDAVNDALISGWKGEGLPNLSEHKIIGKPVETVNGTKLKTSGEGDGFLVFGDSYYPGWRAYVDGRETKIYQTNFFFKGIFVDGGDHEIEFSFIPTNFWLGLTLSIAALLGTFLAPLTRYFTKR